MASRYVRGAAVKATGTITVVNFANATTDQITIAGEPPLNEGSDWFAATSNGTTAQSIADAVNFSIPEVVATVVGSVVTLTAATAGVSGNSTTLDISDPSNGLSISGATLTGGSDATLISTVIDTNSIKIKNIEVKSSGTALDANILNGITSTSTEYDTVTGVSNKTVSRSYVHGLFLPAGGYIKGGADVTAITIDFEQVG